MSKYECKGCGSIISKDELPVKCPACDSKEIFTIGSRDEKEELRGLCQIHIAKREEDFLSELLVDYVKKKTIIYTTRDDIKSEMWIYEDGIYRPNGESRVKEIVRDIIGCFYTAQRLNKVVVKIQADTQIESDDFFNMNYIDEIPVKNGILNIKTKELSDFTSDKIFFNKLPVSYDEDATCENVENFFKDILKHDTDVEVAFELFGYTLLKDHPIEKATMLVGNGRNGKGKFISLLKTFIGAENCCSVPLSQLKTGSTSICELFGKMANLAGDLNNTALRETGLFKEITGRDMVGAPRKYLRDLFFVNYSKQIFACNELPRVYDFTPGFWSRWILLEFPFAFLDKSEYDKLEDKSMSKLRDINIIDKLTSESEMSGLLNRALSGLNKLMDNKDFSYSKGTNDIKYFWIRNSDSFSAFCLDHVEADYEGFIDKKLFRTTFLRYCKHHKLKGAGDKAIKVVMEDMFGAVEGRKWTGTEQLYCWEGVKLKGISTKTMENEEISYISKVSQKPLENQNSRTFQKTSLIQLKSNDDEFTKGELSLSNENTGLNKKDAID